MALVSSCLTLLQKRYGCQRAAINKNTHSDDYPVLLWEVQITSFPVHVSLQSDLMHTWTLFSLLNHCQTSSASSISSLCLFYCPFLLGFSYLQLTPAFLLALYFTPPPPLMIFPSLGCSIAAEVLLSSSQ